MRIFLLGSAIALLACTGGGGRDDAQSTSGPDHCMNTDGAITGDEVWGPDLNPHTISCNVGIAGGTLTIAAGTVVIADANAGIEVSYGYEGGILRVEGTEEEPVEIGPEEGSTYWQGIRFSSGASESSFSWAEIRGGGSGLNGYYGNIDVSGGVTVLLDHVTLNDSERQGLALQDGSVLAEGSTGIVASGNAWPVVLTETNVPRLPKADSDYSGNDFDYILVSTFYGGETTTESGTWKNLGVPYWIGDPVELEGTADEPAVVTIEPGTTVAFEGYNAWSVGGLGGAAALRAEGTEAEPIVFTAAEAEVAGAWYGLHFGSGTLAAETLLDHVEVAYGAQDVYYGNIDMRGASPTIRNASIHHSAGCGIYADGDSAPTLENIDYADNEGRNLCQD